MVCLYLFGVAAAHPYDNREPAEQPNWYQDGAGWNSNYNLGRIVFVDELPDWEELTSTEKKIVTGTKESILRGPAYGPWWREVLKYCEHTINSGEGIPQRLDPDLMPFAALIDGHQSYSELLRSPVTGEFPLLDSEEFSAGDMYIVELDNEELEYFADNFGYRNDWFDESGNRSDNLLGPVLFYRVYGESRVIHQGLFFKLREIR